MIEATNNAAATTAVGYFVSHNHGGHIWRGNCQYHIDEASSEGDLSCRPHPAVHARHTTGGDGAGANTQESEICHGSERAHQVRRIKVQGHATLGCYPLAI